MKLTPEILVRAINEYCYLPKKKKKITAEQITWFADPENVFLMIFFTLTAPDELTIQIRDDINPWIETAISELKLTIMKSPPQAKVQIEEVITEMLRHAHENAMLNQSWLLLVMTILKKNQFNIKVDLSELMTENLTPRIVERPELKSLIEEAGVDSSIEFIQLFEESLVLIPIAALPQVLSELAPYSWAIDALLLLTQYNDQEIALIAAQTLNQYPAKKWSQLSNQQLLNLSARFNRHPAIKKYFKQWLKHAMRYSKNAIAVKINELYLTHIDGNNCSSLMMSIAISGQESQFSMLADLSSGIRETLVNTHPETSITEIIERINEQDESIPVDFIETSPTSLALILPCFLSIQQEKMTDLALSSLYWLSQLPFSWTQPAPFSLENWGTQLDYQADPEQIENSRFNRNIGNELMMSWLAPAEAILAAKKPKDLLKSYYYPNKDTFAQRLAYSAAIQHYQETKAENYEPSSEQYLNVAHALYDPNINRKKFNLFESLADISCEEFTLMQHEHQEQIESEAQGLVVKIMLQGAKPAVWRRVHLSNQFTLDELHDLIQIVMGWEDGHLFQFFSKERGIPEEAYPDLTLAQFLKDPGDEIAYCYDFGDDWQHVIRLEKILKRDIYTPKVTAGNGICPAEDSGGIWNWNHMLKLQKKKNLNTDELEQLEWMGLSPDESLVPFDKVAVNQQLADEY